jgi:copper chaperone CopZ
MTEIKFKTNVNCNHCINKVTPVLNDEKTISEWSVDLSSDDKVLTVKGEAIDSNTIVKLLSNAGYIAEIITD